MGILDKIFGDANAKVIKKFQPTVERINALEKKYEVMSDEELKQQTAEFRKRLGVNFGIQETANAEKDKIPQPPLLKGVNTPDEILPEAFAMVREAAKRTLGQRHFDVQLLGGMVLHQGQIAEMRTGEGKTLVATLPLYLNALTGRGVQLVTVNDYLSRLGAGWMAPIYHFLGMTTGVIIHDQAFRYDPEFTDETQYDDRLKHFRPVPRRDAYYSDIIYGTNNEFGFDYLRDNMVPSPDKMVQRELNYAIVDEVDSILIDEARTPLIISAPAEESTEKYYKFSELVERLTKNEDYNVDEKMRAVTLTEAGIAKMEKWLNIDNIYATGGLSEVHHIEQALKAKVLFKRDRDYVVKEGEVIIVDEFTGRLMYGRRYSEGLHQAIEAKERVTIQRESQTLATITFQNYFRMYNKLAGMTGTAVTEAEEFSKIYKLETVVIPTNKEMIRKDLNDLIYRTEAGKFKAVVEEVKKRHQTGQPILVGTISIEKNEILGAMLEREGITPQVLNAKFHEKEASIIAQAGKFGGVTIATNMAGRGVDIILGGNPPDNGEQRKVIEAGGLHVIGTERHEARRIDNQLRGRSGRQGDPGSSQFYVSMEDDLMRIFGGDKMKNLMTALRLPEDMPIENRMVSKSIESAQRKVEGNNFDIRKHLVEYDDVINKHRETIYKRRREILELANEREESDQISFENSKFQIPNPKQILNPKSQTKLSDMILEMAGNEIDQITIFHTQPELVKDWNLNEIYQVATTIFPVETKLKDELASFTKNGDKLNKVKARTAICEHLVNLAKLNYEKLRLKASELGISWLEIEKAVLLRSIDLLWIEHLEAMDHLRRGIGLRGYGQRDPLVEYKKEAYHLYNELNNLIQKQVVYSIFKVGDIGQFNLPVRENRPVQYSAPAKVMDKGSSSVSRFVPPVGDGESTRRQTAENKRQTIGNDMDIVKSKVKDASGHKVGRNEPCPCGSGKKFKKCCGK